MVGALWFSWERRICLDDMDDTRATVHVPKSINATSSRFDIDHDDADLQCTALQCWFDQDQDRRMHISYLMRQNTSIAPSFCLVSAWRLSVHRARLQQQLDFRLRLTFPLLLSSLWAGVFRPSPPLGCPSLRDPSIYLALL